MEFTNIAEIEIVYKNRVPVAQRQAIKSSHDSYGIFKNMFPDMEHKERMVLLPLSRSNKVLGSYILSMGGLTETLVDVRLIFQVCLKANATSFIICHNHPSGNLLFSEADKSITKRVIEVGKIMNINCLDHILITEENYLSMADEGMM